MKLFEFATRNKIRFEYKGLLSVEDLWDLKQKDLNEIYKKLIKQQKEVSADGLITSVAVSKEEEMLAAKIDIVKYIFEVKDNELKSKLVAAENKAQQQRIMDILAKKKEQALVDATEEELMEMLAKLKENE